MRLFIASLFLTGIFFSLPVFSQKVVVQVLMDKKYASPQNDTIYYDVNRRLTWEDFKGVPDMNHRGGAVTSSGFAYSWNGENDGEILFVNIIVYAFFTKSNSWRKNGINTDFHLEHEQHHFDITYLGAEKLVNTLQKTNFNLQNYQTRIRQVFEKVYAENIALQNEYDRETKNSLNKEKQLEWNERINRALRNGL